jgi:glutamyl-tRNA synthetase
MSSSQPSYRGRLAPSPTGHLHLGHARTFWIAAERARAAGGTLILRNDDLDRARCKPEFTQAALEDLRWLGLDWTEGPDVGGPHAPYHQSERLPLYRAAMGRLHDAGLIFPCTRSRRDVLEAAGAPHEGGPDDEPLYPREFRPDPALPLPALGERITTNWRFRVPDGRRIHFMDSACGPQEAECGRDFGDFLVWRKDDTPSYQLACAVDDALMGITEVVRGEDLIRSTFRQLLLLEALGHTAPAYHHCPLLRDAQGIRLAKRHDALSLRTLRSQGVPPAELLSRFRTETEYH